MQDGFDLSLFANFPDPMLLLDNYGHCLKVNASFAVYFDVSQEEAVGKHITEIIEWENWDSIWNEAVQLHTSKEFMGRVVAGNRMIDKVTFIPVVVEEHVIAVYLVIRDITKYKKKEEKHQNKIEILHLIESNSSDVIAVVDEQEIVRYISPSYTKIFGRPITEILHRHALEYVHPDDIPFLRQRLTESMSGIIYWPPNEFRYLHVDGRWIYSDVRATPIEIENNIGRIILFMRDISVRKQQEELIFRMAYYDTLTELPNRRFLRERLEQALNREPDQLGLLYIDLDGFKQVNDTQGHTAGDNLLRQVGARLTHNLPEHGFLARMGGDEFVILFEELTSVKEVHQFAQMVLCLMAEPFVVDVQTVQLTTSMGISIYPEHGGSAEELIRTADIALYQAKNQGKNRYSLYICDENIECCSHKN